MPILKIPAGRIPYLSPDRCEPRPNAYAAQKVLGVRYAARDVVPDEGKATICRDSGARVGRRASTCSVLDCTAYRNRTGARHFAVHSEALWRVDSVGPAPKIVAACRLQKAARF